jgi:hypothetical protein
MGPGFGWKLDAVTDGRHADRCQVQLDSLKRSAGLVRKAKKATQKMIRIDPGLPV